MQEIIQAPITLIVYGHVSKQLAAPAVPGLWLVEAF